MSKPLSEIRALVTGASGFLGGHICHGLIAGNADVHAVSRSARETASQENMHWWECDVTDATAVHALIARIKPDVIFHLGGMVTAAPDLKLVRPTFDTLLGSTLNILEAVTEVGGGRVVLAGSLEEPTGASADTLVPTSPYAAAKMAAGSYARMFFELYGTSSVNLRTFMTYGPGQSPTKLIPYTILSLLRGVAPEVSHGERALDWVYVDDVVEAFIAAGSRPDVEGRTLDVGLGTAVRIREVIDRLTLLVDPTITPRYGARPDRPDVSTRVADIAATTAALGWRPMTSLDRGLAQTVEWYRRLA